MVCKAILNMGLALYLVFQASAPCCCAFPHNPSVEGVFRHHCHQCPESIPADSPDPECRICSSLSQPFHHLPCSGDELSASRMLAARLFQFAPATEARVLAVPAACRCDVVPLCDIYAMQTLRE